METPQLLAVMEARSDGLVENESSQFVANTVMDFATLKVKEQQRLAVGRIDLSRIETFRMLQTQCVCVFAMLKVEAPQLWATREAR